MSTPTPTPTPVALPALTTPFIPASTCTGQFDLTGIPTTWYDRSALRQTSANVPLALSTANDSPSFSSCQPSGRDQVSYSSFMFSPAVCPAQWTMYGLSKFQTVSDETVTTAYCCSSGFSLNSYYCAYDFSGTSAYGCIQNSISDTREIDDDFTVSVHDAWNIAWHTSDMSSLSPVPPEFGTCSGMSSWTPGEAAPTKGCYVPYSPREEDFNPWAGVILFMEVGIPLISATLLAGSIGLCCWRHKKHKRARARAERLLEQNAQVYPPQAVGSTTAEAKHSAEAKIIDAR